MYAYVIECFVCVARPHSLPSLISLCVCLVLPFISTRQSSSFSFHGPCAISFNPSLQHFLPMMASKAKLSPVKLDPHSSSVSTPSKPEKVIVKSKNNVLETTSPNILTSKFDAMSINTSPSSSPTKRVYHASPAKENRPAGDKLQINLRPPEDDSPGMSEQAKKSLRSINALRGLTIDEIESINKPQVKRLATVTQLCTGPFKFPLTQTLSITISIY